jgi:type III secretion protein J
LVTLSLALLVGCVKEVNLQTGLADPDANEILTLLKRHGISATKTRAKDGLILSVQEGQLARAAELMQAAGLPRARHSTLGQVFKKEGMISTPLEERARYLHGLSQELEYTLSQIDGVVMARVHVVLPERVAPGEPIQPSSASVFLKYQEGAFNEDLIVPRVKRLVLTSIPGLADEAGARKLSVVLIPAEAIQAPPVEWQQVGPFMVEVNSSDELRTAIYVVLSLVGLLACTSLYFGTYWFISWNKTRAARLAQKELALHEELKKKIKEEEKDKGRSAKRSGGAQTNPEGGGAVLSAT